ncbi:MAG: anti-sigma factor (TIGR02949 family) [Gammaproteobacteria bacterium]|jgi:anti-sigma factor (TIGR02949 family)
MAKNVSCEEVMSKLFAFLDQEIDALSEDDIAAHINGCRECYSRAEFEKTLRQKVASSAEVKTPDDVRGRLDFLIKQF